MVVRGLRDYRTLGATLAAQHARREEREQNPDRQRLEHCDRDVHEGVFVNLAELPATLSRYDLTPKNTIRKASTIVV